MQTSHGSVTDACIFHLGMHPLEDFSRYGVDIGISFNLFQCH